jgi:hypothetical protein
MTRRGWLLLGALAVAATGLSGTRSAAQQRAAGQSQPAAPEREAQPASGGDPAG